MKTRYLSKDRKIHRRATYHYIRPYNPINISALAVTTIALIYYIIAYFIIEPKIEINKAYGLSILYICWLIWLERTTHILKRFLEKLTGFGQD